MKAGKQTSEYIKPGCAACLPRHKVLWAYRERRRQTADKRYLSRLRVEQREVSMSFS